VALGLFEQNFERVIRLACAASLAGMEIGNYQIIRSAVSWEIFNFNNNILDIDPLKIESVMRLRKTSNQTIEKIIDRFAYWETLTSKADFDIVRWMCHGHMGLTFIWAAIKRLVYEVSKLDGNTRPESDVYHTLEVRDEIRFNSCAKKWIDKSMANKNDFPFEVLKMLSLMN
jgi:hypothetical protein